MQTPEITRRIAQDLRSLGVRQSGILLVHSSLSDRVSALLNRNQMKTGFVLAAPAHLLECRALWDVGLAMLRKDPFYFVARVSVD